MMVEAGMTLAVVMIWEGTFDDENDEGIGLGV